MPIPSEVTALVERLYQELDTIEREVASGVNLARAILERFPNNFTVIQLSAFLNTANFFEETSRSRIQALVENLGAVEVITDEEIQELGEDLATDLGRVVETRIRVSQVKTRLENLQ